MQPLAKKDRLLPKVMTALAAGVFIPENSQSVILPRILAILAIRVILKYRWIFCLYSALISIYNRRIRVRRML